MNKIEFTKTDKGFERLDKVIAMHTELSRNAAKIYISKGACYINGTRTMIISKNVKKDDIITIYTDTHKSNNTDINIEDYIIYKDRNIITIDKPHNILSQASIDDATNNLQYYLKKKFKNENIVPINRLDYKTAGICLFALNKTAASNLYKQFQDGNVKKRYDAICLDKNDYLSYPYWFYESYLEKKTINDKIIVKSNNNNIGKYSKTLFIKQYKINNYVYLHVYPYTGRTHQIRVHATCSHFPIIGDSVYGVCLKDKDDMMLKASYLKIINPTNNKELEFETNNLSINNLLI